MSAPGQSVYAFGRFRLDAGRRLLFAGAEVVGLTPKAFDTLLALVESRGGVLSKAELMRRVWPEQFVEENNLAQNIYAVRRALGDGDVKYVETIPKRGYRFAPKVEVLESTHVALTAPRAPAGEGQPRPFIPKTHYAVSTGDVNIAYQVVGEGPLDLVFVMGWVSHLEYFWREPSFARFLMRLASFSRLILFDKRGTGLSDRVPVSELPTLEQRMTDVQAVMDAVGSERAALLGISEGGPMCALFAATHPERTAALTMVGTYARRVWSEDYPWAPTEEERALFLEKIRRKWGEPVGIEERAPSAACDPQFREWWAAYLRMGASPAAALALTRMNAEIDVRRVLPSIRVPALVIHRAGDECLKIEEGRYVAARIPGARFVELQGRDHLPFVGDQDAILDEIEEFLTGARPEHRIDRVLTTVLFVLFEDDSLKASGTLQSHVRRELSLFRGREIESSEARLFATFDGPARAIRCALNLVDAAARLGLRARAGLHTGECDVVCEKVFGASVRLGEAIASCALTGETLLSSTVRDLVAGSGIGFEPRGGRALADGEWPLFAARLRRVS